MNVEQKLNANKFVVDEGNPHIVIYPGKMDKKIIQALLVACPAGLYTLNSKGELVFEVAGCLECGTCRVITACASSSMEWKHPRAGFGVQFRYG